jgi:hypothetical protein
MKPRRKKFCTPQFTKVLFESKTGKISGNNLRLHDLRRQADTYASRSGTPIEIISKVVVHHLNLSTTQRHLGCHFYVEKVEETIRRY